MVTRRNFLATAAAAASLPFAVGTKAWAAGKLSAADAHKQALDGELLLVDIRTHGEWKQTGLGATAQAISMHKPGFVDKLVEAAGQDKSKKIGLICATGGRSRWLQGQLAKFGFTNVVDVSEGMLGSAAGQGWLKAGLPVKPYAN
ncbi:MAG: rhodanese-like domain-containing protein [Rhizobiales bacterium]|nr:rhodanese-like domain-containing protein [Hyphomicrobiales bacterium]